VWVHKIEELFGDVFTLELLAEQDAKLPHKRICQRGVIHLPEFSCLLNYE